MRGDVLHTIDGALKQSWETVLHAKKRARNINLYNNDVKQIIILSLRPKKYLLIKN